MFQFWADVPGFSHLRESLEHVFKELTLVIPVSVQVRQGPLKGPSAEDNAELEEPRLASSLPYNELRHSRRRRGL